MNILYCDDNQQWRETWAFYLSSYGFQVETCPQDDSLWHRLREANFDLFICNALQGQKNGIELVKRIRGAEQEFRKMPVLLIEAEPLDYAGSRLNEEKDVHFMPKYRSPEKWLSKIRTIVHRSERGVT